MLDQPDEIRSLGIQRPQSKQSMPTGSLVCANMGSSLGVISTFSKLREFKMKEIEW